MKKKQERTWLTPSQAAEYLQVGRSLLQQWRREHSGPRFYRAGEKIIRYRREDLDAWMLAHPGDVRLPERRVTRLKLVEDIA